jgi:hypothetical protein
MDFAPELVKTLPLPPPNRSRPDEQIVELVLQAFSSGTFAADVAWLPRRRLNVQAMARNAAGIRLAVAHTRIGAFEKEIGNQRDLERIAERLENEPELDHPGRAYRLVFYPGFWSKLLRRYRAQVLDEVASWAIREWPGLAPRRRVYSFSIPIPIPGGKPGHSRIAQDATSSRTWSRYRRSNFDQNPG